MGKNFPIGRILIIGIELFALIMANVILYYAGQNTTVTDNPYAATERSFDSYPTYSGTVSKIEYYDFISSALDATDHVDVNSNNDVSSYYKETDEVEIGIETINRARILVLGADGGRWFYADYSTYIYDSVADECGCTTIRSGQQVNFAYGPKDGVEDCDYVYAIKGKGGLADNNNSWAYILGVLVPSIVIFIFTIILVNAVVKNKEERSGKLGALIGVSIFFIATSLLWGVGIFFLNSYIQKSTRTTAQVRAHAPIIYLYNDDDELINVKLDLDGTLTETYPEYNSASGWNVTASPAGKLTDINGDSYRFLFWEADLNMDYDLSRGFCVKGSDTEAFLDLALCELGLNETEAADFKAYWLPFMEGNPYNVITFQTTAYEDCAGLDVTPAPDVTVRINMLWYASDSYVEMAPQDLSNMNPSLDDRYGLVLVEWGGEVIR